jgi:creatinine amidohydrolase
MKFADNRSTSAQIREMHPEIAVFGIGATEQHSMHLPLGTDWLAVAEITRRVAEQLGAYLVPALPFSMSQCHGPAPGTVWLKPKTLAAVVTDVVNSLQAQGINRIILVNGHGGNFVLEAVIRELNLARPSLQLAMPSGELVIGMEEPIFETANLEVHAGEAETSFHLAFNAEHVKDKSVDFVPSVGREFLDYAYMNYISESGVWGCPTRGTAAKGRVGLDAQVRAICKEAQVIFKFLDEQSGSRAAASARR